MVNNFSLFLEITLMITVIYSVFSDLQVGLHTWHEEKSAPKQINNNILETEISTDGNCSKQLRILHTPHTHFRIKCSAKHLINDHTGFMHPITSTWRVHEEQELTNEKREHMERARQIWWLHGETCKQNVRTYTHTQVYELFFFMVQDCRIIKNCKLYFKKCGPILNWTKLLPERFLFSGGKKCIVFISGLQFAWNQVTEVFQRPAERLLKDLWLLSGDNYNPVSSLSMSITFCNCFINFTLSVSKWNSEGLRPTHIMAKYATTV